MLTDGHEHASAHIIYKPTHKHTLVHAHLRVHVHTHKQHISTCTLTYRHRNMHAFNHSRSHIYTRDCVRSMCIWVCECVFLSAHVVFMSVCVVSYELYMCGVCVY